jgi:hypothetical protein
VLLSERPHERVLDQIVGPGHIPQQCPRVAPEPWDLRLEKIIEVGHRYYRRLLLNQRVKHRTAIYRPIIFGKEL